MIVKKSLLNSAMPQTPVILHYGEMAAKDSMYNTPPVFAIYMAGLVFKWIQDEGGCVCIAFGLCLAR